MSFSHCSGLCYGGCFLTELAHQLAGEDGTELVMVLGGHAQQVGNDQERERLRVVLEEFARAAVDERVELLVGEPPHEVFVLLEALGGDELVHQPTGPGVQGWVLRGDVLAHRDRHAVFLDQLGDVVTAGAERHTGEGARHRVAR